MTSETKIRSDSTPGRSVSSFVIAQLLIVGVAVAGVTYRYQRLEQGATLPPLLETPRMVAPEPFAEHIEVIGEDQLKRVLRKLRPKLNRDTSIAKVDHNLRFAGHASTGT